MYWSVHLLAKVLDHRRGGLDNYAVTKRDRNISYPQDR